MVQDIAKRLIEEGRERQAQDIYLIPRQDDYDIFMRIGDERQFFGQEKAALMASVISHFKFVAGMNVGEKRRSQLGSCDYDIGEGKIVSLRLSSVGDYRGLESLVIRLLFDGKQELAYWFDGLEQVKSVVGRRGLYLFAGPVGSGKTTLMHQLVSEKFAGQQVISIEDPVEIKEDRFLQLQLNESIGMTYDNLIKLSLRHRPDVLIIGEIRDTETARAVVRASLTGAVVLSTVHAKSISGVYERLLELGVSPQELSNCLAGVCYQRLIGKGGLIDIATENIANHDPSRWNQKIDDLVNQGYLTEQQGRVEKIIA
ncbi:competence type IV pilus ATPase ComGA [Streptococcus entericus]|uniref:competence type IV pilus ATPase ComGA n=1 Tax=Streptococcus entericus TaxID=155680 RepID=UPI0003618FBD|nr:competence type IV pilus ATPase ComGA [Streptococcus entericus]